MGESHPHGLPESFREYSAYRFSLDQPEESLLTAIVLASFDNYHLTRKNASYHIVILRGHLWGGRFQMAGVGERQVIGWNGGVFRLKSLAMV